MMSYVLFITTSGLLLLLLVPVLEARTSFYPAPAFIRSDNGPEFIAYALVFAGGPVKLGCFDRSFKQTTTTCGSVRLSCSGPVASAALFPSLRRS